LGSHSARRRARRKITLTTTTCVALLLPAVAGAAFAAPASAAEQPVLGSRSVPIIDVGGLKFRDLDRSGDLTPFEDWRLTDAQRAADLVERLNIAQRAGLLLHSDMFPTADGYPVDYYEPLIRDSHINTFISRLSTDTADLADQHNTIQEFAEEQPFGIPVLMSTDPRNGFSVTAGQTVSNGDFTPFPDPIGMGAIDDPALTEQMGDILRQEYNAVGIREGLSPQADIATEPRWTRINGTFGSVGADAKDQVAAYVRGLQGGTDGLHEDSSAAVVKHWVGYGAQQNGYDSHYYYGRYAIFPGDNFAEHLTPYEGAFDSGAAGIMPTYSILKDLEIDGQTTEQVGAGHNEYLLQDLLRGDYDFDGLVTSDWGIINDCPEECRATQPPAPFFGSWGYGMPWGVEDLTIPERAGSAINAGVDTIGGSSDVSAILGALDLPDDNPYQLSEERLDEAAYRVLLQKFQLGLFEDPYVDVDAAAALVGNLEFRAVGDEAQRRSLTLLTNDGEALPLGEGAGRTVYLYGVTAEAATAAGFTPVDDPADAEIAIVRLADPRGGDDLTDLDFTGAEPDYQALVAAHEAGALTIAVPQLARPLILTNVVADSDAVLADYGVSDEVLLRVLTGAAEPEGTLPFELPSSMEQVDAQLADVPNDTADPLFPYRFGLRYSDAGAEPVPAGDDVETLPDTGADVDGGALAALLLLGLGGAMIGARVVRRRMSA
jgi:beta-glucosidase